MKRLRVSSSHEDSSQLLDRLSSFNERLKHSQPLQPDSSLVAEIQNLVVPGVNLLPPRSQRATRDVNDSDPNDVEDEADTEDDETIEGEDDDATEDPAAENSLLGAHVDNLQLADGTVLPVAEYFRDHLSEAILALHNAPILQIPDGMLMTPHPWQVSGYSKMLFLRKTEYKGGMIGDEMGLGKTLTAIMAMKHTKEINGHRTGPALVVSAKGSSLQWIGEIEASFQEKSYRPSVVLWNTSLSAFELDQYDIVVTTYQALQRQYATLQKFEKRIQRCRTNAESMVPDRPQLSLFSDYWRDTEKPFDWLVLDECQMAKNTDRPTFNAVQAIYRQATLLMSGTFVDNKWKDCWALHALLGKKTFLNRGWFIKVHGMVDRKGKQIDPSPARLARLQKSLMGFCVARSGKLLNLEGREESDRSFKLGIDEENSVRNYMQEYADAKGGDQVNAMDLAKETPHSKRLLALAVRAMQAACHPLLEKTAPTRSEEDDDEYHDEENNMEAEKYEKWLQEIRENGNAMKSSRVKEFITLHRELQQQYPGERMLVWSTSTLFLDVVEVALLSTGVSALRYDGRVQASRRQQVHEEFGRSTDKPMLITAGAGGVGLNMTEASIVIQLEVWWNRNTELQAYARAHRQGQKLRVKIFRLVASNSEIDKEFLKVQRRKTRVNEALVKPIVRNDDVPPEIPTIY